MQVHAASSLVPCGNLLEGLASRDEAAPTWAGLKVDGTPLEFSALPRGRARSGSI
jgi:hypothetical protein